jgi:beta-lactamase class A
MLSRRRFALSSLAVCIGGSASVHHHALAAPQSLSNLPATFAKLEAESGGRLGVAVIDTHSDAMAGHRETELFPLCSTFKLLATAAVLTKIDTGQEQLTRRISIEPGDVLSYAPVAKQHVGAEGMSIAELCEAAVALSDNTAANLILNSLGGPGAITRYARSLGDNLTRLDRIEPELNSADPGDPRDTTTPAAMARDLDLLVTKSVLSPASRDQLVRWLVGCKTGNAKIRAGAPKGWRVGDKTGSGDHGSSNDVAVIWPPHRAPVIIAAYLTETALPEKKRNAIHAAIGQAVAAAVIR